MGFSFLPSSLCQKAKPASSWPLYCYRVCYLFVFMYVGIFGRPLVLIHHISSICSLCTVSIKSGFWTALCVLELVDAKKSHCLWLCSGIGFTRTSLMCFQWFLPTAVTVPWPSEMPQKSLIFCAVLRWIVLVFHEGSYCQLAHQPLRSDSRLLTVVYTVHLTGKDSD